MVTDDRIAARVRLRLEKLAKQEPPVDPADEKPGHKIFLYPIARHILRALREGTIISPPPLEDAVIKIESVKTRLKEAWEDIDATIKWLAPIPATIIIKTQEDYGRRHHVNKLYEQLESLRDNVENLMNDLHNSGSDLIALMSLRNPAAPAKSGAEQYKTIPAASRFKPNSRGLHSGLTEFIGTLNRVHGDLGKSIDEWEKVLAPERRILSDGTVRYNLKPYFSREYIESLETLGGGMTKLSGIFKTLDDDIHGLYIRVVEELVQLEMEQIRKRPFPPG